jgi:excisionase family DNA binding protein
VSDEMLSPTEVADFLHVPVATVYGWRQRRVGPKGYRVGRHVRYRRSEVEGWLETQADLPSPAA